MDNVVLAEWLTVVAVAAIAFWLGWATRGRRAGRG
jgi:hypothetical protein